MNTKKPIIVTIFIISLISLVSLFLQEFNQIKLGLLLIFILNTLVILSFFYLEKTEKLEKKIDIFAKLKEILDLINTPICLYDDKMKIVYFNKPFERFTNLSQENLSNLQIGTWILNNKIYQNLSLVFFPVLIASSVKMKEEDGGEVVEINFKDEIVFDLISSKLEVNKQLFNLKIIIDKTLIFKEIKEKSEFLNLLAHHLRTPLNQAKWGLESLLKESNISEENKNLLSILFKTVSRAIILAESVIWLNRVEAGSLKLSVEINDIEDILKSSLDLLEMEIQARNLNVKMILDENVKKFPFDNKILFLALYPLIENAILYNKPNGEIKIEVEKIEDRPYVRITIEDTGFGFSEKDFKHLFEKYYRSKIAKEINPAGTGIGLYLARNLINIHKGKISIDSQENKGTKITIELPRQKELII